MSLARTAPRRPQLLAPIVPLLATFAVWLPLRRNYFSGDDFFHLHDLVTRPLSNLLGQVWGGHLLVLYNAAFWTLFQLFGTDPRGYVSTVILTHLLNTFLVFRLIRPHGPVLACFGALLWGTCPVLAGACSSDATRARRSQSPSTPARISPSCARLESSQPSRKVDARTLAFDVPVPAGGEAELRYRIQVGQ